MPMTKARPPGTNAKYIAAHWQYCISIFVHFSVVLRVFAEYETCIIATEAKRICHYVIEAAVSVFGNHANTNFRI